MNNKFMKELNELMTIALTLIKCSKEKCTTTQQKMMQDKEILKEIIVVNLESNLAKKKNLIENVILIIIKIIKRDHVQHIMLIILQMKLLILQLFPIILLGPKTLLFIISY